MRDFLSDPLSAKDAEAITYISDIRRPSLHYDSRYELGNCIDGFLRIPSYELKDMRMTMHDVVWGDCEIGDEPYDALLMKLARTPLFRRLQSVEQLTLGPNYATMPNTMHFSRWQHIWGSLAFVRKMTEGDARFDEKARIVMQLRTLFSDVGQTAFSHLGDWIFQGVDGGENLHDEELMDLLKNCGIQELLEEYGLTLEETVFPDVEDWVECPSPDLCVDRLDYGLREILRWVAPSIPIDMYNTMLQNPKSLFEIDDQNRLVVKDIRFARFLTAAFSLLPTEHWQHPVHRAQLEMLQSLVKSALIDQAQDTGAHPRELMYGIDADFEPYFHTWNAKPLSDTMKRIAYDQRTIFLQGRRADLNLLFSGINEPRWEYPEFPDPLKAYSWQSKEYGDQPVPTNMQIEESQTGSQSIRATERGLEIALPALKARQIDPMVNVQGMTCRYSEWEPSVKPFFAQMKEYMARHYKATIFMRPDYATIAVQKHEEMQKKLAKYSK